MTISTRTNFQAHPFHLVSPSLWPLSTCFTLLALSTSLVLWMHDFTLSHNSLYLAIFSLILTKLLIFFSIIYNISYQANHSLALHLQRIFSSPPMPHSFVGLPLQSDLSSMLDTLQNVATFCNGWPYVEAYIDSFDKNVGNFVGNIFRPIGVAAPLDPVNPALETVSVSNVETVSLPNVESSSVTNNSRAVWPFLKGTLIAACTTLVALYSPNIIDWIHPIPDGFYVLNLYYIELMFSSIHVDFPFPTYVWEITINWWNKFPNHIPYGFNFFNLLDGMRSGYAKYIINYANYAPNLWEYNILSGQSHSDKIEWLMGIHPGGIAGGLFTPPIQWIPEVITPQNEARRLYELYTSQIEFTPWKWVFGGFLSICIIRYLFNLY